MPPCWRQSTVTLLTAGSNFEAFVVTPDTHDSTQMHASSHICMHQCGRVCSSTPVGSSSDTLSWQLAAPSPSPSDSLQLLPLGLPLSLACS